MIIYPNKITMDGREKEVFTGEFNGQVRWVVFDDSIYVDKNSLGVLFALYDPEVGLHVNN